MARTKRPANVIGPEVRRLRLDQGLTQEELAALCQLMEWHISRGTLSQVEAQISRGEDLEQF